MPKFLILMEKVKTDDTHLLEEQVSPWALALRKPSSVASRETSASVFIQRACPSEFLNSPCLSVARTQWSVEFCTSIRSV